MLPQGERLCPNSYKIDLHFSEIAREASLFWLNFLKIKNVFKRTQLSPTIYTLCLSVHK